MLEGKSLTKRFGALVAVNDLSFIIIEQDVRSALELSDVGYVLETGKVVLGGCCEEILREEHIKRAYLGV